MSDNAVIKWVKESKKIALIIFMMRDKVGDGQS